MGLKMAGTPDGSGQAVYALVPAKNQTPELLGQAARRIRAGFCMLYPCIPSLLHLIDSPRRLEWTSGLRQTAF